MSGIAEAMSKMAGGKRDGISEHMGRGHDGHDGKGHEDGDGIHEHLKAIHEKLGGGKHMHVQHHEHDGSYSSHQVHEDGNVEGPHDHENLEALKDHMGKFFNEEEHEPAHSGGEHEGLM